MGYCMGRLRPSNGLGHRWVFDNMATTERAPMSEERKQALRAGRLRSEVKVRAMKHDLIVGREELVNSPEFRAKHTSNTVIGAAYKIINAERVKFKLNEDGTPMTIDDEIAFRRSKQMPLTKDQWAHLGLEAPAKKADKAEPITAAELEAMRPHLTETEYEELSASVAA
jgi:hypothetical protein